MLYICFALPCRCKAFNTSQLIMFMNEIFDEYMKQRLLDVSLCRRKVVKPPTGISISKESITRCNDDQYQFIVKSQSKEQTQYTVDLKTGLCDCSVGMTGQVCKHQVACSEQFLLELPQVFKNSPENRHWLASVALGNDNVPPLDFFATLKENPESVSGDDHSIIGEKEKSHGSTSHDIDNVEVETPPANIKQEVECNETGNLSNPAKPSGAAVLQVITEINDTMLHLASQYGDEQTLEGMQKFLSRLKSVRTSNQLNSLLHSTGSSAMQGAGRGKIPCQPTSVARRQVGMPRGTAPIGKGRKRKGSLIEKAMKRQRNLALNISLNQPNAKSHGSGH